MRGAESGFNQYFWYTAKKVVSTGNYTATKLGAEAQDSTITHRYDLDYLGTRPGALGGIYAIRRDGLEYVDVSDQGVGGSCISQVGLASNVLPYSAWFTGTFDATSTYWRDTGSLLHTDFGYSSWVDNACGQGYTTPNCFNGVYYGIDWWSSNKP